MSMYSKVYSKAERIFSHLLLSNRKVVLAYINHLIHRQMSPASIDSAIYRLSPFFKQLSKEKRANIASITKKDIREVAEELSGCNFKPSTINARLHTLKSFFAYLVDEDCMEKNPVLDRYFLKRERRLPKPMTKEDLKVFLDHIEKKHHRAIFLLMLRCGLRVGEVCTLKKSNINWERKQLIILNGKGRVDRVVYFSEDAGLALKLWLEDSNSASQYCFPSPSSKKENEPIVRGPVQRNMKKILQESGLGDKGYSCHTLRHTFATLMLNAGIPLYTLKELMGHKSMDETLRYAKLFTSTVRESYDKAIETIFNDSLFSEEGPSELFKTV